MGTTTAIATLAPAVNPPLPLLPSFPLLCNAAAPVEEADADEGAAEVRVVATGTGAVETWVTITGVVTPGSVVGVTFTIDVTSMIEVGAMVDPVITSVVAGGMDSTGEALVGIGAGVGVGAAVVAGSEEKMEVDEIGVRTEEVGVDMGV